MKTAISIPDPLFHSAERAAKRMHISRSRLFTTAVSRYVHDLEKEDVTTRLNAVYKKIGAQAFTIPPALVQMQAVSIPKGEW